MPLMTSRGSATTSLKRTLIPPAASLAPLSKVSKTSRGQEIHERAVPFAAAIVQERALMTRPASTNVGGIDRTK